MFGRRYRYRSTANVIEELSRYDPKRVILFIYDDNFTANPRRAKELLREMIRLRLGFQWSTQVRADVARDPEMLSLMREAGCTIMYIGFESVDEASLKAMKKSQTTEEMHNAIGLIHAAGIAIHGMFVLGFDTDTPRGVRETVRFAVREKISSAQFLILTPLPGSEFYSQMVTEGRILDTEWDTYDAHHVKFRPAQFTPWELQMEQVKAHAWFYSPLQVARRLLRGRFASVVIGLYAQALNRRWKREERGYLRTLRSAPASAR